MLNDRKKPVVFLLGSGISLPAGMPSTQRITEQVLSGQGVHRHPAGRYCFGDPPDPGGIFGYRKRVAPVLSLLNVLKRRIDAYYKRAPGRSTNYEDLFYAAFQIHTGAAGRLDNPAVQPFIEEVQKQLEAQVCYGMALADLARETCNYIKDIVAHMLSGKASRLDHLRCIRQACRDDRVGRVDLFTLNHDEVLERLLCDAQVHATDGFRLLGQSVRRWDPALFEDPGWKARLFKLHGSVRWFPAYRSFVIPLKQTVHTDGYFDGKQTIHLEPRPELLIGTFNKVLEYPTSVYMDLHYYLYRSLRKSRTLIVSGYGFGDLGINRRILEWAASDQANRIALIHKRPDQLKHVARSEIRDSWDDLLGRSMLVPIQKWIEQVTWQELRAALAGSDS